MPLQLVVQPLAVLETSESERLFEDLEPNTIIGLLLETDLQWLLVSLHHEPNDLLSASEVRITHDSVETEDGTIIATFLEVLHEHRCLSILS